jgi:hypothetical protein
VPASELEERLAATRFTVKLQPFQLHDLGRQLRLRHAADFSACGAGKTVKAYAAYELRRASGQVRRLLVVAPLSAFDAWEQEAQACFDPPLRVARFGGDLQGAEVLLVHYHLLARHQERLLAWMKAEPTMMVLDEGHRIKRGRGGTWGAAALALGLAAAHRLLLTGTPAPQGLTDLEALVEFLWPTQGRSLVPATLLHDDRPEAADAVADRLRPLFVRTGKGQLGLLPPRLEVIREPMTPLQRELYQALRGRLAGALSRPGGRDLVRLGQCVLHLVQAAVNPALLSETPDRQAAARYAHAEMTPALTADLLEERSPWTASTGWAWPRIRKPGSPSCSVPTASTRPWPPGCGRRRSGWAGSWRTRTASGWCWPGSKTRSPDWAIRTRRTWPPCSSTCARWRRSDGRGVPGAALLQSPVSATSGERPAAPTSRRRPGAFTEPDRLAQPRLTALSQRRGWASRSGTKNNAAGNACASKLDRGGPPQQTVSALGRSLWFSSHPPGSTSTSLPGPFTGRGGRPGRR